MKDDSWSLEGKGVWKDHFYRHEEHWYPVSDIETLRKKLIGDLIELFMVGYNKDKVIKKAFPKLYNQAYDRCIKGVKILINKRFGVNE